MSATTDADNPVIHADSLAIKIFLCVLIALVIAIFEVRVVLLMVAVQCVTALVA